MNLRDLRWRVSQAPPRLRLLIGWSLRLLAVPFVTGPINQCIRNSPADILAHLPAYLLGTLIGAVLLVVVCGGIGAAITRTLSPPGLDAAFVSLAHDHRYTVSYPLLFALSAVMTLALQLLLPNGPFVEAYSAGVLTNTAIGCTASGGIFLSILLNELPPPRPRTVRARAPRLGTVPGGLTPL